MQKMSPSIFRVILLTILLVNSMLASAAMPCDMDSQNGSNSSSSSTNSSSSSTNSNAGSVVVSESPAQMDHSQHNMDAMDVDASLSGEADCCDSDCLCEMGCSTHIVLLDAQPTSKDMHTTHNLIYYIDSIANARQNKIYHPPILT